jgi:Imm-5 like putative immunity protein
MGRQSNSITLSLDSLRALGSWAADCAERALPVYETHAGSDSRPRAAIDGIRQFAAGGKRTARLRSLGWEAYAAAREIEGPDAEAAARAASLAAAIAYTHPLATVHQAKHILAPAANTALALELNHGGDPNIGDGEVRWAIEHATSAVRDVLRQMPARQTGKGRFDAILHQLDAGLRGRI